MAVVAMKQLLEAGVHFGHQTRRWDPKMAEYIFQARNGIHIIDLQKTSKKLDEAYAFLKEQAEEGKTVLFVGTKKQAQECMKEAAIKCGMYYVDQRWLGGMLTNFETIRTRVQRLKDLEAMQEDGTFDVLPKKEVILLKKEMEKLERNLGGIKDMEELPGVIFLVDPKKERIAILEARKLDIPVIGLVDTNCNPEDVDYAIPGNDDAIRAVKLIADVMANAVIEGRQGESFENAEEQDISEEATDMEQVVEEKNETMEEPVNRAKNNKEFLLIIEDHDEMREYLCSLFKEDYNVIEAGNGEEGVAMADKYIPKLIISDIMMPVKDGFECSREIRENKRTFHIPVIFLTAKAEDADRLKSLQIGVDDYIMKPFNPELLKEKVKALIEQRDLLRKLYAKTLMLDEEVLESSEDVQDVFMPKMLQIIEENLSNRNFTIKVLTDKLNMSQPTLYRKVKQKTGLSIIEVIHGVRMSKAASIIMSGRYSSLTEVAEMVGYDSMISFRKQFVAQFGVLPSKYMEEKMRK